jgi:hypothetical protein
MGESFSWNVRIKVNLGKKLTEDRRMRGGFESIKLIQTTKTAQITPGKDFSKDGIMSDNDVITALIEALYDLKTKIDSITVGDMLPYADINYSQTTTMNESVERLIRRMVKQIKQ